MDQGGAKLGKNIKVIIGVVSNYVRRALVDNSFDSPLNATVHRSPP